jgi:hypothetical protein
MRIAKTMSAAAKDWPVTQEPVFDDEDDDI